MNPTTGVKLSSSGLRLISLFLVSCLPLFGCNSPNAVTDVAVQTTSLAASSAAVLGSPTLSGPDHSATKIAGLATFQAPAHELETRTAQGTPFPTRPYIPLPSYTPQTVWTPTLGISGECAYGNHQFDFGGCWIGIVNSEYLLVHTGAMMADPPQGMLRVFTMTMGTFLTGPMQYYPTPLREGRVHPTQVSWPIMTLVTLDANPPDYFAFNLETRQWVPATPGPTTTMPMSPVPSVSPLPTQGS